MKQIKLYLALAFILIIPVLLGGRMILSGDFYFLIDQARDMLLVQDIVENRDLTLIGTHSGLGGFFHGPAWLYQLVPFYLIGNGDPLAFTYAYLSIALVTVFTGYFFGSKLYDAKGGILLSFLLAISPSIWPYIPNTIGVNMVPLVFIPMFYFLARYIQGDKKAFIFSVFFAGFSLQYETALPLIIIPVVFISFFLNKKAVKDLKLLFWSIASFSVSVSSFILFDLKHNFLQTRSLLSFASSGEKQKGYLEFPDRVFAHFESFMRIYKSILITDSDLLKLSYIFIIALFCFIALKQKLYKKEFWKSFIYLAVFPAIIFSVYLIYPYPVFPEYLIGLTIPVAFAFVFVLKNVWSYDKLGKSACIIFALLTLIEGGKIVHRNYLMPYGTDQTDGSYKNQKEVTEWIIKEAENQQFGYFVYMPSTYTYPMDYLMQWEATRLDIKKPESKKHPLTYLILYPPLQDDLKAHDFWKKNKIRTSAEVSARKEFKSGIIVEKLIIKPGEEPEDPLYHQRLIFR
jgi:hypothetical protein